jgi:hypothetical protein
MWNDVTMESEKDKDRKTEREREREREKERKSVRQKEKERKKERKKERMMAIDCCILYSRAAIERTSEEAMNRVGKSSATRRFIECLNRNENQDDIRQSHENDESIRTRTRTRTRTTITDDEGGVA